MDQPLCPGCSHRDRHIDELNKRLADLEKRLDEKDRAGKRQAAPFSKGEPTPTPKKPGRKAGPNHGPHGHRPPPPPETITATLEAPLPQACPHCGGSLAEDADVDEQFQTDLPTQPIGRKFRIHKGCCTKCGRRVCGHHPLQTSEKSLPFSSTPTALTCNPAPRPASSCGPPSNGSPPTPIVNRKVFGGNRTAAGCQAQVIIRSTIQTCKQQQRSAFGFLRDAISGVVRSIFQAATGASPIPATR